MARKVWRAATLATAQRIQYSWHFFYNHKNDANDGEKFSRAKKLIIKRKKPSRKSTKNNERKGSVWKEKNDQRNSLAKGGMTRPFHAQLNKTPLSLQFHPYRFGCSLCLVPNNNPDQNARISERRVSIRRSKSKDYWTTAFLSPTPLY